MAPVAYAQSQDRPLENEDLVTVEGEITRDKTGVLKITLPTSKEFEIKSAKRQCQEDLSHLDTGDHLVGLGRIQSIKKLIWLDEVEMVGIKKVLGNWDDARQRKRFQFRDFTSLDVSDLARVRGQSLNYRLVPDKKDEWTIFLSTDTTVKVGTMKYLPSKISLEVIDMKTGQVGEQYNLNSASKK